MAEKHKVSGFILSCNEEKRILTCLKGLAPYVDEIVVLDGGHDKTASISESLGARVYVFPQDARVGEYGNDSKGGGTFFEPYRREIGLGLCRYEKVLIIDADELIEAPIDYFRECNSNLYMPRYNLITPDLYITVNGHAWWPDFQCRFVTHDTRYHKSQIHCGAIVKDAENSPYPIWHYKRVQRNSVTQTDTFKVAKVKGEYPLLHQEMIQCCLQ